MCCWTGRAGCWGDAVAYRDSRTRGMDAVVERTIPAAELYARTGIQKQSFNTIYQLAALQAEHPEQLARAGSLLMIPDYFNYLLTGVQKQEYTNATSTGLVNARDCRWDRDLLDRLGLPSRLFGELSMPGTVLGPLAPGIAGQVGFEAQVVLPATHDTGSAFLAVPARDSQAVYLSSGTWSLLGVENPAPITTEASRAQNFTNEGGAWRRYRYLKNIMGLWMIQSVRRELNGEGYVAGKACRALAAGCGGRAEAVVVPRPDRRGREGSGFPLGGGWERQRLPGAGQHDRRGAGRLRRQRPAPARHGGAADAVPVPQPVGLLPGTPSAAWKS